MPLFMITAKVRTAQTGGEYHTINYPSHDNEVRNHNSRLQAEGFDVLEVKAAPFDSSGVSVDTEEAADDERLYKPNTEYDKDPTPGFGELIDENDNTDETSGSSN